MTGLVALLLLCEYLPAVLAAASVLATVVHTLDEVEGEGGPIWTYLARTYGPEVPDWVGAGGLLVFSAAQAGAALVGYAAGVGPVLWALATVRTADCLVSHWGPWLAGRRPNPGLATTPLYAGEATLIAAVSLV